MRHDQVIGHTGRRPGRHTGRGAKKDGLDPAIADSAKVANSGYMAKEVYLAKRAEALVKGTGAGR